jgi:hypothetical protein
VGTWISLEKNVGHFYGKWASLQGKLSGHFKGIFGKNQKGMPVFYGKYIAKDGRFMGLLQGSYGQGLLKGGFLDKALGKGTLQGALSSQKESSLIVGIWSESCNVTAAPPCADGSLEGKCKSSFMPPQPLFCKEGSCPEGMTCDTCPPPAGCDPQGMCPAVCGAPICREKAAKPDPVPPPSVTQAVKCVFEGSSQIEQCYADNGVGCKGQGACVSEFQGQLGETVTWKSSCGGYAYTKITGENQYAFFKCSASDPSPCSMACGPGMVLDPAACSCLPQGPLPCKTDADCADGMSCQFKAPSKCSPGEKCLGGEPEGVCLPPPQPLECLSQVMGDPTSCKDEGLWKKYAFDACLQQGLALQNLGAYEACGPGLFRYVKYTCCK